MTDLFEDDQMPSEIDFSDGTRGLHYIRPTDSVYIPVSIERSVWEHFAALAQQRGLVTEDLVTAVLKREIDMEHTPK